MGMLSIGLGNVVAKLAGTLLRNNVDLTIRDSDKNAAEPLLQKKWANSPREMAENCDLIITCLPLATTAISAAVMESDGIPRACVMVRFGLR